MVPRLSLPETYMKFWFPSVGLAGVVKHRNRTPSYALPASFLVEGVVHFLIKHQGIDSVLHTVRIVPLTLKVLTRTC
jgi:hypothetical protein